MGRYSISKPRRRRGPPRGALRPLLGLLLLAIPAPAAAHLPHPYVISVAADPEDEAGVWAIVVIDGAGTRDTAAVFHSDDAGAHFAPFSPQPPIAAADYRSVPTLLASPRGVVLLATNGDAWRFDGVAWVEWPGPGGRYLGPADALGDKLAVATSQGVAVSSTGGESWVLASPALVRAVAFDAQGGSALALLADDGAVSVLGVQREVPVPPFPADALAWGQGQLFVGGAEGVARLDDEGWIACAELPRTDPSLDEGGHVVRLAGDTTLLAAGTGQALYLSEDACRSWQEAIPFADAIEYDGGLGSSADPALAYAAIRMTDDRLVVAGWSGIAAGPRTGDEWEVPRLLAAFTRGLTVSSTWPDEGTIYATTYGGGSVVSADGGASWFGSGVGLFGNGLFGRDVAVGPDQRVYFAGDVSLSESQDGGASYALARLPTEVQVDGVYADTLGVWLLGIGEEGRALLHKDPGGAWDDLTAAADAAGVAPSTLVSGSAGGAPILFGVRSGAILRSTDAGETWIAIASEVSDAQAVTVSQEVGAGRVMVGSLSALYRSEDAGDSFTRVDGDVPPVAAMVDADDGTLFVADDAGHLWRSEDAGSTWAALDASFVSVQGIVPLASFAEYRTLLVVSLTGVYWSSDAGETWNTLPTLDRLDDAPGEMSCVTVAGVECAVEENEAFGSGRALALGSGDTVAVAVRGASVRWVGSGDGTLRVSEAGVEVGELAEGEVASLGSDRMHDLVFVATASLRLDALEAQAMGEAIPIPSGPAKPVREPEDCGCAATRPGGRGGGEGALGLLLLVGGFASVQRRHG